MPYRRLMILLPVFLLTGPNLLTGTAPAATQVLTSCDSVTVRSRPGSNCLDWTFHNRNEQRLEITSVRLELKTPGYAWIEDYTFPPFTVTQPAPHILEVDFGSTGIRAGGSGGLRSLCLDRLCQTTGDFVVEWKTYNGGNEICSGEETLSCQRPAQFDSLNASKSGSTGYCYDATLYNVNSVMKSLDQLRFRLLTPGIGMNAIPRNGWVMETNDGTTAAFSGNGKTVPPGNSQDGYSLCFSNVPPSLDEITLHWESSSEGQIVTTDTLVIPLEREQRCDSIAFRESAAQGDQRCWEASLFNLHEPIGPIDGMTLQLLSPDAVFLGDPSGPWPITQETPIFLRWRTSVTALPAGDSIGGFTFCVLNSGASDTIRIRLSTSDGSTDLCSMEYSLYCPATQKVICDRFTSRRLDGDSYEFGFINLRQPPIPVNGFTVEVLGGTALLDSVSAPVNWTIDVDADTLMRARSSVNVAPNTQLTGFFARFAFPGQEDSVHVRLCTTFDGRNACCDTLHLALTSEQARCDSLILEKSMGIACQWRTGFIDTHLPASQTTGFRLSPLDSDVAVNLLSRPTGWSVISDGGNGEIYLVRGTATEDSLSIKINFTSMTGDSLFVFDWCTEDSAGTICCGTESVFCAPETRCDMLESRPGATALAVEHRIRNEHLPASGIDAISFVVRSPNAFIQQAATPSTWTQQLSSSGDTLRLTFDRPLEQDSLSAWFTLQFETTAECDSIRYNWCTAFAGAEICCADAPAVACPAAACDTLTVTAIPFRPCCFSIAVRNGQSSALDRVSLRILTPGARLYPTLATAPDSWDISADSINVTWSTADAQIEPGAELRGFTICYDNDVIDNEDFRVLWETYIGRTLRCSDTLTIACDRTLQVEALDAPLPARVQLHPNFPNPFRGRTQLTFDLPARNSVSLQVFDTHGRLVASLCEGSYDAGSYRVSFDATGLPAGAYLLRLRAGDSMLKRLMSLVR